MRNRTEHGLSWLTAISDAGSTPAASTNFPLQSWTVSSGARVCHSGRLLQCVVHGTFGWTAMRVRYGTFAP